MYGFGVIDGQRGPSVLQVPDFGDRFWVYQAVDQRTDSFVRLGAMYQTTPGLYLLAPQSWDGQVPSGVTEVFRFGTRIAVCIPRVFMDDTDADRAAIQPVINQVMMYPLSEYTGEMRGTDWTAAPSFPGGHAAFPASTIAPPDVAPAPMTVWISSMNRIALGSFSSSLTTDFSLSSKSPR